jgi:hypothetical protein
LAFQDISVVIGAPKNFRKHFPEGLELPDNERQSSHDERLKADRTADHSMHGGQDENTRGQVFGLPTWRYFPAMREQKP